MCSVSYTLCFLNCNVWISPIATFSSTTSHHFFYGLCSSSGVIQVYPEQLLSLPCNRCSAVPLLATSCVTGEGGNSSSGYFIPCFPGQESRVRAHLASPEPHQGIYRCLPFGTKRAEQDRKSAPKYWLWRLCLSERCLVLRLDTTRLDAHSNSIVTPLNSMALLMIYTNMSAEFHPERFSLWSLFYSIT